jgi:hypothetical protein
MYYATTTWNGWIAFTNLCWWVAMPTIPSATTSWRFGYCFSFTTTKTLVIKYTMSLVPIYMWWYYRKYYFGMNCIILPKCTTESHESVPLNGWLKWRFFIFERLYFNHPLEIMANQRIKMQKLKKLIELTISGTAQRSISTILSIHRRTVVNYQGLYIFRRWKLATHSASKLATFLRHPGVHL